MKDGSHFRSGLTRSRRPLGDGQREDAHGRRYASTTRRPALSTMVVVGALVVSVAQPMTSSASAQQKGAPTAAPVTFFQPAHQITVSVSADTKAAVSGAISSSAGGSLKATGANGVQYVLHFPPGALAGDETVSMTPLSAVHGSPLGNLVGAVAVAPDGMELVKPATLTLLTTEHVSPQQDAGFAAGFGKDFSLYPLSAPGKASTPGKAPALAGDDAGGTFMSVSMLSTYGVSSATNAQVSTAVANPPFTTEAQFQQLLVAALRDAQVDTIDSLLAAYFTQVVTPLVNQGLKDYTQMDAAVDSLLLWANTVASLGFSTDSKTAAYFRKYLPLLTELLVYEAQKVYEHCKANRDLGDLRQLLLGQRQAALLGVDLGPLSDAAQRCGHFQLDVTSDLKDMGGNVTFLADLSAKIDLSMNAGGTVTGDADPVFTLWQVNVGAGADCSAYKTVAPSIQPVKVYDLGLDDDLDLIRYAKTHGLGYLQPEPEIEVTFQPGNSREEFDRDCPGLGWQGPFTDQGGLWWYAWRYLHQGEMTSDPATVAQPKFLLKQWTVSSPGPGSLIAQKSYHHAAAGFGYPSEQTELTLYMLPQ